MANDKKKMVEAITAQEVDFAQWYTDICTKAELVEYSSVKGFVVLRPYGYAIWENIQKNLDARFKATGHENVAMPVLIPESLLKKEGELVERLCARGRLGHRRRQRPAGGAPCGAPHQRDDVLRPFQPCAALLP